MMNSETVFQKEIVENIDTLILTGKVPLPLIFSYLYVNCQIIYMQEI